MRESILKIVDAIVSIGAPILLGLCIALGGN